MIVERVVPWHQDEYFWETIAPILLFSGQTAQSVRPEVDRIVSLLDLTAGDRVLDLGCGLGYHVSELARRSSR